MLTSAALVLVAVINDPRDLEIARILGWYRIPLRSAPRVVAVDYLAFYQTAAFGGKPQIEWVAPLMGHELTTRRELLREEPDHPHANHEYYKMQLGPLEHLPFALPAGRWKRVTFFYTTGEYLLNASSVDDLIINATDDRRVLWQALRERSDQDNSASDLPEVDVDPAVLAALLGIREI